jgi:selenium metabolism protein YedF
MVDPGAPRENVTRFAQNRGMRVQESEIEGGYLLTIAPTQGEKAAPPAASKRNGKTVMLISSDRMGEGPEELGRLLMKNFIITLLDLDVLPDRILFLNSGVLLATEGSEALEALENLGNRGVEVLSCGACLDYFHRKELLVAGGVTNMFTIAEALMQAESVVKL